MDIVKTRRRAPKIAGAAGKAVKSDARSIAEPGVRASSPDRQTAGAQSLRRGLELMRMLAQRQEDGATLSELVEATGLERPTAYRLLCCLEEERFAERHPQNKRYRLGLDALQLGAAAGEKAPVVDRIAPVMKKLARLTGDTVFLVVPQGDFTVCLHREEGPFPVRVFTTVPGQRRLLGIGAGGLALMARMSDTLILDIHRRRSALYAEAGMPLTRLMAAVEKARKKGYSEIADTITTGVSGIGCAFGLPFGTAAALSLGAISSRMESARRAELGALMCAELGDLPLA
ncbi:IclR family transcriptional regulator [Cupriavidus campinensis]